MASPMSFKERTLAFGVPDSEVAFSREEYRRRLNRVRDRMANAGAVITSLPRGKCATVPPNVSCSMV